MSLNVCLYEPEIPPNTGNIIRLCANAGAKLHLIEPLSFAIDDTKLKRAGLDYHEFASIEMHSNYADFCQSQDNKRIFACSTKGTTIYTDINYRDEDVLLFGPETRGLPQHILSSLSPQQTIRIPMLPQSRSINLANSVAIILYEAWRQLGFKNGLR